MIFRSKSKLKLWENYQRRYGYARDYSWLDVMSTVSEEYKSVLDRLIKTEAEITEEFPHCKSGQVTKGGNMRLVDFIPEYYANIKSSVAPTTMKKYQYIIENMIVPALGHMKLKDIKPIHIQRFVNDLTDCNVIVQKSKDGTVKTDAERKLSPATGQRYYTCLRSIMHNAYSLELIPSNPCDKGKIKVPSIGEQTTEIFDKEALSTT